ncbi:MAG TPA: thiamine-phosphate kinase [Persephonella sp.]|uniref:Thiamine-monophosphate kinase n=1 Tax=Persephonella marina (strain DSM 14350 / EX-H1) TaxID=123214 RepID=C0QQC1_PERMH|nr:MULTISPECIES: thiamine-phosphate kinase [Persephonella]ACO04024.1 thiamine-monophosphate kinase [Persephonella marina EX-H1]HCB69527.1 thiamine-phosphate kinase [Persephonella sp.]
MKVKSLGEFGLIDRLTKILRIDDPDVVVGFGDDCACVNLDGKLMLFTGDIQLENHHFIKGKIKPEDLGWKLVSINVSDIVACGGKPRWGFISIGIPESTEYSFIEGVYKGMNDALDRYGFSVIGGNTTSSEEIILDLFLVGETERFVPRGGAEEGEVILLSGFTGCSRAGLELLLMDRESYEDFEMRLIEKHTRPEARYDLQNLIQRYARSCIDISDGLVGDLSHIQKMSGVKLVIEKDKLPVDPDLERFCKKYGKDIYDYILYGGEDYQLVFTVNKQDTEKFKDCFKIGYTEKGSGIFIKDEKGLKPLKERGFEHL